MVSVQCTLVRQAKRSANRRRSEEDAIVNARIYPRAAFTHSSVVGSREQRDATRRDRDAKDLGLPLALRHARRPCVPFCLARSSRGLHSYAFACIRLHSPAFAHATRSIFERIRTSLAEPSRSPPLLYSPLHIVASCRLASQFQAGM